MRPTEKSWSRRPLPEILQQYCKLMCEPVKLLADRMIQELGSLGKAKVLSMSRAAAERSLEPTDRDPVDLDTRQALLPACMSAMRFVQTRSVVLTCVLVLTA